jgi:hypothetical protein
VSGGRIRSLKPEILEDERTASLSHSAWRLFVSLILLADDYGNLRGSTKLLDGTVFWAVDPDDSVSDLVAELAAARLVTAYQVNGQPRCPPPPALVASDERRRQ